MGQKLSNLISDPYQLPIKLRVAIAAGSLIYPFIFPTDGSVNRRLIEFLASRVPPSTTPVDGATSVDVTIDPSRNLWFRLFVPVTATVTPTLPVVVFFHGGGFQVGSPDSKFIDSTCRRLAVQVPAVIVSSSYRLSPEHTYPCPYEDGFDVLSFIDDRANWEKIDPIIIDKVDIEKCFIVGESAGGNLAHHVLVRVSGHEFESLKIRGAVMLSPFYGGEKRTESELRYADSPTLKLKETDRLWRAFLPVGSSRDHPAANLFGPESTWLSGIEYPSTLLVVAGLDPLQDRQRRYRDELVRSGKVVEMVEYPNMVHGFHITNDFPETEMLFAEIQHFIHKQLSHVKT